jgi:hypothetical protein
MSAVAPIATHSILATNLTRFAKTGHEQQPRTMCANLEVPILTL